MMFEEVKHNSTACVGEVRCFSVPIDRQWHSSFCQLEKWTTNGHVCSAGTKQTQAIIGENKPSWEEMCHDWSRSPLGDEDTSAGRTTPRDNRRVFSHTAKSTANGVRIIYIHRIFFARVLWVFYRMRVCLVSQPCAYIEDTLEIDGRIYKILPQQMSCGSWDESSEFSSHAWRRTRFESTFCETFSLKIDKLWCPAMVPFYFKQTTNCAGICCIFVYLRQQNHWLRFCFIHRFGFVTSFLMTLFLHTRGTPQPIELCPQLSGLKHPIALPTPEGPGPRVFAMLNKLFYASSPSRNSKVQLFKVNPVFVRWQIFCVLEVFSLSQNQNKDRNLSPHHILGPSQNQNEDHDQNPLQATQHHPSDCREKQHSPSQYPGSDHRARRSPVPWAALVSRWFAPAGEPGGRGWCVGPQSVDALWSPFCSVSSGQSFPSRQERIWEVLRELIGAFFGGPLQLHQIGIAGCRRPCMSWLQQSLACPCNPGQALGVQADPVLWWSGSRRLQLAAAASPRRNIPIVTPPSVVCTTCHLFVWYQLLIPAKSSWFQHFHLRSLYSIRFFHLGLLVSRQLLSSRPETWSLQFCPSWSRGQEACRRHPSCWARTAWPLVLEPVFGSSCPVSQGTHWRQLPLRSSQGASANGFGPCSFYALAAWSHWSFRPTRTRKKNEPCLFCFRGERNEALNSLVFKCQAEVLCSLQSTRARK